MAEELDRITLPKGLKTKKTVIKIFPIRKGSQRPLHSMKYYQKPAHLTQLIKEARAAQSELVSYHTQAEAWKDIKPEVQKKVADAHYTKLIRKHSYTRKTLKLQKRTLESSEVGSIEPKRKKRC